MSAHLLRGHAIHPEEYRALFGLRATTSLMAPGLREVFRRIHEPQLRPQWARAAELARAISPEQRTAYTRGRRWPLEALRDPRNVELHRRTIARAQEGAARARSEGRRWWRNAREIAPLGLARIRELAGDPTWLAARGRKISAAHRGRTPVPCLACGEPFVSLTGRKTCSPTCERERRRAHPPAVGTPEVRAKISQAARRRGRPEVERLRELAPAAFEGLPEPNRAMTRLYYGLEDGHPWSRRELAARFGLSTWAVKETVARSTRYLLTQGPAPDPGPLEK
ncbi:MAG: hypothetical protein EPO26_17150 [Chloroflexota bacterium]|nr:MAG: hypothetical protein EPO26_17150 [Chloroflexota bacterium]